MATIEQLETALRNADAAGDTAGATTLAKALKQARAGQEPSAGGLVSQGMSGVNEGIGNVLGFPVDAANSVIGLGMRGVNAVAGTDFQPSDKPFLGSGSINEMLGATGTITPESDVPAEQMIRRVGQSVGASVIPGMGATVGAARPAAVAIGSLLSGGAGGVGAATAQRAFPDNPMAEMIGEFAGGFSPLALAAGVRRVASGRAASGVPTVEQLKDTAGGLYDEAERIGVTAAPPQTQALAASMRKIAFDAGLISPTGRLNSAYPKISEAVLLFDDYAMGSMTVPQMKAVRAILSDAAGSTEKAERRLGKMMLDEFDNFTAPLAPPLQEARGIYSRAMRGGQIEQAIELAGSRAGQFSGSGYENALRTEFRNLDRRIIKGYERGFSPDEVTAIKKVARGGSIANVARWIGKAAPSGIVSGGVGFGVPFMAGNAIGGPAVGTVAGLGTMGAGLVGREIATKLGIRNAATASAVARAGGNIKSGGSDDTLRRIAAALAAAQSINSGAPAR